MSKKTTIAIVAGFFVFLAAVLITMSVVILNSPDIVTDTTAGNFTGTLMNGGHVLDDKGYLFYTVPGKPGVNRVLSEKLDEKAQIAADGDGYLQIVGKTYYYASGDALKSCKYDGSEQKTILSYAKNPLVVGSFVYYIDASGNICRSDANGENITVLPLKADGQMMVYMQKIYYVGEDGRLYSAKTDGSGSAVLINAQVDSFLLDGKYLFYLSEGMVYSYSQQTAKVVRADSFMVKDDQILYNTEKGLFLADMNRLYADPEESDEPYEPVQLADAPGTGFGIDNDHFYFFNKAGDLCRVPYKGDGEVKVMPKS